MKSHSFVLVVAAFALMALATQTSALDFDFAKIIDTNTPIPEVGGTFDNLDSPALDGYQVAVSAERFAGQYEAIYVSSGGVLVKVVDTNTPIPAGSGNFTGLAHPSISGGHVAFEGFTYTGGQLGIYTNVGGLTRIADTNTPIPGGVENFISVGLPSLDGSEVAFFGSDSMAQEGIYSTVGGLHVVADHNMPVPNGPGNFINVDDPSMDGGNLAFKGYGSAQNGIYTNFGGTLQIVADTTMPMPGGPGNFYYIGPPSFSNGNVAFWGAETSLAFEGIYTDIGGLHPVADTTTSVPAGTGNFTIFRNHFSGFPSLDNGSVAFLGGWEGEDEFEYGIFTDYGGTLSRVVTTDMQIDGKQVDSINGRLQDSLSNGNVAFNANFSDGTSAIYVAEQNYTYTADTSGAWDTASNWSFGLKPRAVVPTFIRPEYGVVITGPEAPTTIRSLNIGSQFTGVAELRLQPSGHLMANEWLVVETLGRLNVNGGVATGEWGIDNYGEIDLAGGQINGGGMYNSGTLRGSGTVGNFLFNFNRIQAIDAHMQFNQGVFNFELARVDARNALLEFNGGLTNSGRMNFSFGTSDVFGDIQNEPADIEIGPGGRIIISGGAGVTFYGDVTQDGTLTVSKVGSTTSVAVFLGNVYGDGATGGGDIFYEGEVHPGSSPALVTYVNDVTFGSGATLEIELGGTLQGSEYDALAITGTLALGGTLDVVPISLGGAVFQPQLGNVFEIASATAGISGSFAAEQLPDLGPLLDMRVLQQANDLFLAVVPRLAGDYNANGTVDAADYVVWRNSLGQSGIGLAADGSGPLSTPDGLVNQLDYLFWKSHFGQTVGSGAVVAASSSSRADAAIPEPVTWWLTVLGCVMVVVGGLRTRLRGLSHPRSLTTLACLALAAAALNGRDAVAAFIAVYGGPEYDASTGTGYQSPGQAFTPGPDFTPGIPVNYRGTAVGWAHKYVSGTDKGTRAVRWTGSGAAAIELGHLGTDGAGVTYSEAYAVNDSGIAAGYANKYVSGAFSGYRPVRWAALGTAATELGLLGTDGGGMAHAVNDSGTAVGWAFKNLPGGPAGTRAVRWDGSGTAATELGHLGTDSDGSTYSIAYAVNDSGTAVGDADKYVAGSSYGRRAVRWDGASKTATELDHLGTDSGGTTTSYAYAVNDSGTAVGWAVKYVSGTDKGSRAVRWDGSGTTAAELGNLGTDDDGYTSNRAYAVNASGTAVGWAHKYNSGYFYGWRAVRWNGSGTSATELAHPSHLGTGPGGRTYSEAYALNDSGTAVGWANQYDSGALIGPRAMAWTSDALAIDLNTLIDPKSGWTLTEAHGISNTGWITGVGEYDPDGAGGDAAYDRLFVMRIPPVTLPGDYNRNGIVDAADYVVWRDNLGTPWLPNDPIGGPISSAQYDQWRANFGQTAGSGATLAAASASDAIPEPATLPLLLIAGALLCRRLRRGEWLKRTSQGCLKDRAHCS